MAPLVTAIREPQRGGSQAFVSDLARGLTGRGHDVHVYAASGSEIPGVEVAGIFYPKAVSEVRRRGSRRVPFEVLGINPPRDLAFKVLPT